MLFFTIKNKLSTPLKTAFIALVLFSLVACDSATITGEDSDPEVTVTGEPAGGDPATLNILETAVDAGTFTTLVAALELTGLDEVLADDATSFTVFAPTDDAFAALGSDTIDALLDDPDTLTNILLFHVLPGAVDSQTAIGLAGSSVDAANGDALAISATDGTLFINSAEVLAADIAASNGVIHVIDTVLMPGQDTTDPGVADDGAVSGGASGGTVAGGVAVDGGDSDAGGAAGGDGDAGSSSSEDGLVNIVETAVAAGNFDTLAAALGATGLDTVLADENTQFTVFAPTDAAFEALGEETINALLSDTDTLSNILLYHVISGTAVDAMTAVSLAGSEVTAANGEEVALSLNDNSLFVNLSQVTVTDVIASNGIIHVIDTVLTPPAPITVSGSVADVIAADVQFTTLVAALQAAGLDSILADKSGLFTVFAPTDAAFAQLSDEVIEALFADPAALSELLLTHVISGTTKDSISVFAATGTSVVTASGTEVAISIRDGALFVNDVQVIFTDIVAENGIIHVIDSVIQ